MPFKYDSPVDRIIANTIVSDELFYDGTPCWIWIGTRKLNRCGTPYGTISVRGADGKVKKELVHRYVLREIKGRRLTRQSVGMHLCNNTLCAAPLHLAGGTQRKNVQQCVSDGRHYAPRKRPAAARTAEAPGNG